MYKLKKIANAVEKRNGNPFSVSVEKQARYLDSLREPKDLLDRSYLQYKCQMRLKGRLLSVLVNLASAPLLLVMSLSRKSDEMAPAGSCSGDKKRAIFFDDLPTDVIPSEVTERFEVVPCPSGMQGTLTKGDRSFFRKLIFRYPFSWHFLLKALIKLRQYRAVMNFAKPDAFIVCSEYSFASSLLTEYLHGNGIMHVNVMHGEKLFFIRDSFFQFDTCYVWDEELVKLFVDLRAAHNQFHVSVPSALKLDVAEGEHVYDFTYYLGSESERQLHLILQNLRTLRETGAALCIRPHPRYTDAGVLSAFEEEGIHVEDTRAISLKDSLMATKRAVSLYSTVLRQAREAGLETVVDDLSDPTKYRQLVNARFTILSSGPYSKLSDYVLP